MRLKVPRNSIALPTSIDTSNNEIETRIDAPVVQSNSTSENHDIKTIFDKAAARVCEKCYKTRILDFRAAEKFPLGSYKYGGKYIKFDLIVRDWLIPIVILRKTLSLARSMTI